MADDTEREDLHDLIDRIKENTDGDEVSVSDLVDALGSRAFGSLFVLTSLLALLPTGAIPGMSVLTGTIMLLLSLQLLLGRDSVWLPRFILRRSMERSKLVHSLEGMRGTADRVDRILHPRLQVILRPPFLQLVAFGGAVVSLSMYPLAVVPFGAFPAGLSLLVVGLGLMTRDGLLIAVGLLVGAAGLALAVSFWPL